MSDSPVPPAEQPTQAPVSEPETPAALDVSIEIPDVSTEISAELAGLAELPVEEHPEVYEDVHRRLGETLSGIDHV